MASRSTEVDHQRHIMDGANETLPNEVGGESSISSRPSQNRDETDRDQHTDEWEEQGRDRSTPSNIDGPEEWPPTEPPMPPSFDRDEAHNGKIRKTENSLAVARLPSPPPEGPEVFPPTEPRTEPPMPQCFDRDEASNKKIPSEVSADAPSLALDCETNEPTLPPTVPDDLRASRIVAASQEGEERPDASMHGAVRVPGNGPVIPQDDDEELPQDDDEELIRDQSMLMVIATRVDDAATLQVAAAAPAVSEAVQQDRIACGLCPECGAQLFKIKRGILNRRTTLVPLTMEGICHVGRCIRCQPEPHSSIPDPNDDGPQEEALRVEGMAMPNIDQRRLTLKEFIRNRFVLSLVVVLTVGITAGIAVPLALRATSDPPTGALTTTTSNFPTSSPLPTSTPTVNPSNTPSNFPTFSPPPTSVPTVYPTSSFAPTSRLLSIASLLEPLSGVEALLDASSPQHRALRWVSDVDPLQLRYDDMSDSKRIVQRYILATLYYTTGGEHWLNSYHFLDGIHECDWWGVAKDNKYGFTEGGVFCSKGREIGVNFIHMFTNNLTGTLPVEIQHLPALESLSSFGNNMHGPIPEFISNLPFLGEFLLHQFHTAIEQAFSYDLDDTVSVLLTCHHPLWAFYHTREKVFLGLDENKFTGTIPEFIGVLSNLQDIWLYGNKLNGTIPSLLGELSNLENLSLDGNALTGGIPESFSRLSKLELLYVQNNMLNGTIPASLARLTNLERLVLRDNKLTGSIPHSFGNFSGLKVMKLDDNLLEGSVPAALGLLTNLDVLTLHGNSFTGTIPEEICQLEGLNSSTFQDCDEEPHWGV